MSRVWNGLGRRECFLIAVALQVAESGATARLGVKCIVPANNEVMDRRGRQADLAHPAAWHAVQGTLGALWPRPWPCTAALISAACFSIRQAEYTARKEAAPIACQTGAKYDKNNNLKTTQ